MGDITIPYAMINSISDSSIVSENVTKYLKLKIDRKNVHRLNGIASKSHFLEIVNNVSVTTRKRKLESPKRKYITLFI